MPGCYVVFHKQLGDLVLLQPTLARLRDYHGAPVRVLTRTRHAPVLRLMDGVEYQYGPALRWLDHLYCFDALSKSTLKSLLIPAGSKRCVLPETREMKWFHRPIFGKVFVTELGDRHVAKYFWETVPVPTKEDFRPPTLSAPPADWRPQAASELGETYVLLNPTSGWRKKSWQPERWAETMREIHDATGLRFVMTSASSDWQVVHCAEISRLAGDIVTSLSSGTRLEEFLWICANAKMVLTVDGAAAHLALAFRVPSVTLFGQTSVANWHYETDRNTALQAPPEKDGARRLRALPADPVIKAALRLVALQFRV